MLLIFLGLLADIVIIVITIFVVRSKFWKRTLLITYFTLVLTQLATWITSTDFFSLYVYPENLALQDFDLTDYAMANLRKPASLDDRIVIVNIGNVPRKGIGEEIKIINEFKPKAIGLMVFFNCEGGLRDSINCPQSSDTLANRILSDAIRESGKVVMASKFLQKRETVLKQLSVTDSMEYSDPIFSDYASNGFVSLPVDDGRQNQIILVREMIPFETINGENQLSFGAEIVKKYDSAKVNTFLARQKQLEIINFRRNIDLNKTDSKFNVIDVSELLNDSIDRIRLDKLIKGKIVLMGFLGNSYGDLTIESVFYTPFNKITYGRSLPDMFGVVLHANIISMILDEDYINEVSRLNEILIGFLSCLLHVALLLTVNKKYPRWFDIIAVALVVVQLFLGSWLRLMLFTDYNIKIQLYFTMASLAIASISINVCRELYHSLKQRLPMAIQKKL